MSKDRDKSESVCLKRYLSGVRMMLSPLGEVYFIFPRELRWKKVRYIEEHLKQA